MNERHVPPISESGNIYYIYTNIQQTTSVQGTTKIQKKKSSSKKKYVKRTELCMRIYILYHNNIYINVCVMSVT